jgi:hypothetical protein
LKHRMRVTRRGKRNGDSFIPAISPPRVLVPVLREIGERILNESAFDRVDWSFRFSRPLTEKQIATRNIALFLWEVNEIVENLNTVLSDLRDLASAHDLAISTKVRRFRFSSRVFFCEFGRIEDAFGRFLNSFAMIGLLNRAQKRELRQQFYRSIKPIMEYRNSFVHGFFFWGLDDNILQLHGDADQMGLSLHGKNDDVYRFDSLFQRVSAKRFSGFRSIACETFKAIKEIINRSSSEVVSNLS